MRHPRGDSRICQRSSEVILDLSTHIYIGGEVRVLGDADRKRILEGARVMAAEALRLLAVAFKFLPRDWEEYTPENVEEGLTIVGIVGMIDPPREEVPEAVRLCKRAGIKTIMITGDHKVTAVAIAKRIGMISSDDESHVLTGEELEGMTDDQLMETVDEVRVYARTSPEHKMRIAQALKRQGHTVAVTGDGVNDAPAVKAADIGIAMGIKGTDVTKEASSMILEDDNFATIVSAVEEGRHIYENITKYVRLMVTVNFDEFFEITLASLAGMPLPLLPIQILWVNLVSDGLPAVALSIDPKEPGLMDNAPRDPNEGILTRIWRFILIGSALDFVSSFAPFVWGLTAAFTYWGPWGPDDPLTIRARTIAFTAVVFYEFILAYQCRSASHSILALGRKGFTANKMLFISVVVSSILQIAIIYTPVLQGVFNTAALTPWELGASTLGALLGFLMLPGKLIKKARHRKALMESQ